MFSWSNDNSDGALTPLGQSFRLHVDDELILKKDCFNLIIDPTGPYRTSIFMVLLEEMHYIPSGLESWMNLPRDGQEFWVQNKSIKVRKIPVLCEQVSDNGWRTLQEDIAFGSPFDERWYKKGALS